MAESYLERFAYSQIPVFPVPLRMPVNLIAAEAQQLRSRMVVHRRPGWRRICLHGLRAAQTGRPEAYGYEKDRDAPYDWTEIADECPASVRFIRRLPYKRFYRVRFMLLEPGGEIPIHADQDEPCLGPLNIAVTHPADCHFYMEGFGEIPFTPGKGYLLNLCHRHWVVNSSQEDRYHMIVHGQHDQKRLDRLLLAGFD